MSVEKIYLEREDGSGCFLTLDPDLIKDADILKFQDRYFKYDHLYRGVFEYKEITVIEII